MAHRTVSSATSRAAARARSPEYAGRSRGRAASAGSAPSVHSSLGAPIGGSGARTRADGGSLPAVRRRSAAGVAATPGARGGSSAGRRGRSASSSSVSPRGVPSATSDIFEEPRGGSSVNASGRLDVGAGGSLTTGSSPIASSSASASASSPSRKRGRSPSPRLRLRSRTRSRTSSFQVRSRFLRPGISRRGSGRGRAEGSGASAPSVSGAT